MLPDARTRPSAGPHRAEALRLADAFRARVIDATTESFVFEITGNSSKISQFIDLVENLFARPACKRRLLPGVTPRLAARALHALIIGLFTDWTRDPQLFDPLTDTPALIDAQLRGLLREWNPPA